LNKRLTALIVGYGYMGQIRRRVVDALPDLSLCGICDSAFGTASVVAGFSPRAQFTDYCEAIDSLKPDIVFVCTPNKYSPDICVYALENGCHVFCEKPPGRSLEDVRRIRKAEQAHPDLKVMFGFNHRHHPAIVEAKSLVDAGRMGRIIWLRGVYGKSGGSGTEFERSWRNDPEISGGGILLDQGIHMLDLFRFFCGDFEKVHGIVATGYWNIGVEDNAFVLLKTRQGQTAQLHSSATLWKHTFRLEIGLENGYLVAQGLLSKTGSYGRETLIIGRKATDQDDTALGNPREEIVYFDRDLSWDLQVKELVRCIQNNEPVTDSTSLDAVRVMELIAEVYSQNGTFAQNTPLCSGGL
jgi:predicted dehydrogenase